MKRPIYEVQALSHLESACFFVRFQRKIFKFSKK